MQSEMLKSCLQKAFYQKGTHSFQKEAKLRVKMYSWPIQDLSRHGASLLKKIKADFTQSRWRTSSTKHFTFSGYSEMTMSRICPVWPPVTFTPAALTGTHTHTHSLTFADKNPEIPVKILKASLLIQVSNTCPKWSTHSLSPYMLRLSPS